MKNILLHVFDDDAAEARRQVALDLARTQGAHVTCLQVTPLTAYVASDAFGGVFVMGDLIDMVTQHEDKLRGDIEARMAGEDVSWNYVHVDGEPAQTIIARSRLADLIVLSRALREPQGREPLPLVGDVALHSRCPVFAVPPEAQRFDACGRALVAWNGSPEAAAALRAALPMLRVASTVDILTVEEKEPEFPATDACEYLARHGIRSELHCVARGNRPIDDLLLEAVERLGASYLVMGAYGHSRAREYLFGGVTRRLLGHAPVPLLLAH